MKNILLLFTLLTFFGCNTNIDFNRIIPSHVDNFAREFIGNVQNGNIDKCLSDVVKQMRTPEGETFLLNVSNNISRFKLDSLEIINAKKTNFFGDSPTNVYSIEYQQKLNENYIYFSFEIREQKNEINISGFDARRLENSLTTVHEFTFENKSVIHYLFVVISIIILCFVIFTLITAIRTPIKRKWLWIIGILFAFIKFKLNWTTGDFDFQLISFQLFGAGFSKQGLIAPWILSFSIPIFAIIFWIKRSNTDTSESKNEITAGV